jgi:hypothetical protein
MLKRAAHLLLDDQHHFITTAISMTAVGCWTPH